MFFSLLLSAQNKLQVSVQDLQGIPVVRAIVLISQNDSQVGFGTTSPQGTLEKLLSAGTYQITVSKLGFVAQQQTINLDQDRAIAVKLEVETNKLETIIIKSRPKIMRVKEDTISYNIKTIVDGTERKAQDIIKKFVAIHQHFTYFLSLKRYLSIVIYV